MIGDFVLLSGCPLQERIGICHMGAEATARHGRVVVGEGVEGTYGAARALEGCDHSVSWSYLPGRMMGEGAPRVRSCHVLICPVQLRVMASISTSVRPPPLRPPAHQKHQPVQSSLGVLTYAVRASLHLLCNSSLDLTESTPRRLFTVHRRSSPDAKTEISREVGRQTLQQGPSQQQRPAQRTRYVNKGRARHTRSSARCGFLAYPRRKQGPLDDAHCARTARRTHAAARIQTHAIRPPAAFIIARPGSCRLGRILFIRKRPTLSPQFQRLP